MNSLTPEEKKVGSDNYYSAVTAHDQMTRRNFLVKSIAAGGVAAAGAGAMYYGYQQPNRQVRVCVIGTGDEGNVLMGAINPAYVQVTAICDIRPSSIHRAFHGDYSSANAKKVRPGLMDVYGWKTEDEARKNVRIYSDWKEAIEDPNIDAVIIATPLFMHAPMAVAAMQAGKHVLCEKLMAHNVAQCKLMTRVAEDPGNRRFMSIGHQRHYSILYDNAVNLIRWGLLGEIHHIRAQWHRGNLPGRDSWTVPIPGGELATDGKVIDKIATQLNGFVKAYKGAGPSERDKYANLIALWQQMDADKNVDAEKYGYLDDPSVYPGDRTRSALEELVRWRLWDRTGGGLMAELGSHQLDAASIFIAALSKEKGKHVHPLTVHAVGGRQTAPRDRDAADHVYCTFEYPGQGYGYDFDVGYYDTVNDYGYYINDKGDFKGGESIRTKRIRTRKLSSRTRRSTAMDSAATEKSCWAPKAPWCWRRKPTSTSIQLPEHRMKPASRNRRRAAWYSIQRSPVMLHPRKPHNLVRSAAVTKSRSSTGHGALALAILTISHDVMAQSHWLMLQLP